MPSVLPTDPDFIDSVERSPGRLGGPRAVEADAAFVAARKAAVWDPKTNVRAQLAIGKPLTAEDICRMTGLMPEQCAHALCELDGMGEIRRVGGLWEKVLV